MSTISDGTIKYNGSGWYEMDYLEPISLSVLDPATAYAIQSSQFNASVYMYSNSQFNSIEGINIVFPNGGVSVPIDAVNINNVFIGGDKIYRWDNYQVVEETGIIGNKVKILKMVDEDEGWAITSNGIIYRKQ